MVPVHLSTDSSTHCPLSTLHSFITYPSTHSPTIHRPFIYPSTQLSIHPSNHPSIHPRTYPSIHPSIHHPTNHSFGFIHPPIHTSIYLPVHLHIHSSRIHHPSTHSFTQHSSIHHTSIYPPIHPIDPPIHLFIFHPSIRPSIIYSFIISIHALIYSSINYLPHPLTHPFSFTPIIPNSQAPLSSSMPSVTLILQFDITISTHSLSRISFCLYCLNTLLTAGSATLLGLNPLKSYCSICRTSGSCPFLPPPRITASPLV